MIDLALNLDLTDLGEKAEEANRIHNIGHVHMKVANPPDFTENLPANRDWLTVSVDLLKPGLI